MEHSFGNTNRVSSECLGSFRAICRLVRRSGCRLKIKRKGAALFKQIKKRKSISCGYFSFVYFIFVEFICLVCGGNW